MLNQYGDFGMASAMGLGGASQMGGGAIPNMPGMSAPQGSPCVLVNKLHEGNRRKSVLGFTFCIALWI